jgi:hypothetical protein
LHVRLSEGLGNTEDSPVVNDCRKRIVEVLQKALPIQILLRIPEALLVGFNRFPAHEKQLGAGLSKQRPSSCPR